LAVEGHGICGLAELFKTCKQAATITPRIADQDSARMPFGTVSTSGILLQSTAQARLIDWLINGTTFKGERMARLLR
jgi:hypothetical protein